MIALVRGGTSRGSSRGASGVAVGRASQIFPAMNSLYEFLLIRDGCASTWRVAGVKTHVGATALGRGSAGVAPLAEGQCPAFLHPTEKLFSSPDVGVRKRRLDVG